MSISARLATGAILLLALAGCTDNRAMERSSPGGSAGPPGLRGSQGLDADQVICPPGASSRNACVPAPILTTDPA